MEVPPVEDAQSLAAFDARLVESPNVFDPSLREVTSTIKHLGVLKSKNARRGTTPFAPAQSGGG